MYVPLCSSILLLLMDNATSICSCDVVRLDLPMSSDEQDFEIVQILKQ